MHEHRFDCPCCGGHNTVAEIWRGWSECDNCTWTNGARTAFDGETMRFLVELSLIGILLVGFLVGILMLP